jgi:hypothetical protein
MHRKRVIQHNTWTFCRAQLWNKGLSSMDEQKDTSIGIIKELGELPPDTVLSEEALARMFSRHRVSIKRAVERGELPPSVRLFGEPVWTVQALRDHMNHRLEAAKKEAEQLQRRISQLSV